MTVDSETQMHEHVPDDPRRSPRRDEDIGSGGKLAQSPVPSEQPNGEGQSGGWHNALSCKELRYLSESEEEAQPRTEMQAGSDAGRRVPD